MADEIDLALVVALIRQRATALLAEDQADPNRPDGVAEVVAGLLNVVEIQMQLIDEQARQIDNLAAFARLDLGGDRASD